MLPFVKMHGLGNDFVLIDCTKTSPAEGAIAPLAKAICHGHFGVGADGLILVLPSRTAHFRMRIFNSDGSEAEMSGNGIRCFAKYVFENLELDTREPDVETLAGLIQPRLAVRKGKVVSIQVDMGQPRLSRKEIPMKGKDERVIGEKLRVLGERYEITALSMGNPHCVVFVEGLDRFPVETVGPAIENHDLFPKRTNVEFVHAVATEEISMRVWERGVGETMACGTGASAALVACVLTGRTSRKAKVHLPGGDMSVEWRTPDDHVFITGPAEEVFRGEWP
jgi:diaminopimelate epimerase